MRLGSGILAPIVLEVEFRDPFAFRRPRSLEDFLVGVEGAQRTRLERLTRRSTIAEMVHLARLHPIQTFRTAVTSQRPTSVFASAVYPQPIYA